MALFFNAPRCRLSPKTPPRSLLIGRPSPSGYPSSSTCYYLTALANHLVRYKLAEYDVFEYVQNATGATYFVPLKDSACLFVQYDVLFEEINRNLWLCVCVCACAHTSIQITYNIYAYKTKCTSEETIMCLLWNVNNRNIRFVELIWFKIYMKQFIPLYTCIITNKVNVCVCVNKSGTFKVRISGVHHCLAK